MKHIALFFLSFFFFTFGFAQKSDLQKWSLKGPVSALKEITYLPWPSNDGKDSTEYYYLNSFDKNGNKITDTRYRPDGSIEKDYQYTYNNRLRKEERQFRGKSDLMRTIYYTYDSLSRLMEDKSVGGDGKPEKTIRYYYNEKGEVYEDVSFQPDGKVLKRFAYQYDMNGNRIEVARKTSDGTLEKRTVFVYDPYNNVVDETTFNADNSQVSRFQYLYVYDRQNNWIKKTKLENGKPVMYQVRTLEYLK